MAPLLEQNIYNTPPAYLTPEEPSEPLVDSPLETRQVAASAKDNMSERDPPTKARKASHSPSGPNLKRNQSESTSGLRFMVVEHPDQLKDKTQMRKNRIHVMHNYLAKEAQNPDSKDSRVHGQSKANGKRRYSRKGTPPQSSNEKTLNASAPSNIFRHDISRLTPAESVRSNSSHDTSDQESTQTAAKSVRVSGSSRAPEVDAAIDRWHSPSEVHKRGPLVKGIGGYFENSRYMRAAIEAVPFSFNSSSIRDNLTGSLEPFGTWPSFSDPGINVNELKWKCSLRFGSSHLSMHWIPTILRARHAFLSTLCISSSHDDIMTRSLLPPHLQTGESLETRWKVRNGVIHMINESISDPEMRTADETIIAVLHVLNSEIMGCNDSSMRVHQDGLHAMVLERGGLDKLGAGGQIAFVLTITNYMIAALRENTPHRDYVEFASKQNTKIPHDAQQLPESPIYNRPQGYQTINSVLSPGSKMYELLSLLRSLTIRFYIEHSQNSTNTTSPFRTAKFWEHSEDTVSSLYGKIFAIQTAAEQDFDGMSERYVFESVRLAALIYAHALANKIPFSKAASQVRSSSVNTSSQDQPEPMPIQIKKALIHTDLSYCWDHLAGVLFWVTLISGAAANPGSFGNEDRVGEDEDARKWLTAISVRCCIVLSFEYGHSVLETLRRLVAIETALAETPETIYDPATDATQDDVVDGEVEQQAFGPIEPPLSQRGFADFAQEFLSI